jgi:lysophospholipase L1-like esterase
MRSARAPWFVVFLAMACAHELAQTEALTPTEALAQEMMEVVKSPSPASGSTPTTDGVPLISVREPGPRLSPALLELRARAQRHLLGAGNEIEDERGQRAVSKAANVADDAFSVDGNGLGNFVEIENDAALHAFYASLRALSEGRLGAPKLHVLAYGASHTQGDLFTGYLRHYLQSRFGNGGLGFMQFAAINDYYRSADATVESKGFKIEHVQRKDAPEHGLFGLLGAAAVARYPAAIGTIERSARAGNLDLGSELELYYMGDPRGGALAVTVDGARVLDVHAKHDALAPRYASVSLPANWNKLSVRSTSKVPFRLFGGTFETTGPGIVIDTLGINGTRAANMLAWDETVWRDHVARRDPRLVLLAYGTNETVDTKQPIGEYEANLRVVIARVQSAAPGASCLLVGPGDFPKEIEGGGGFVSRPRLLEIIDVQRKLAFELGCGFFDTFEFMGGEGSMLRWARALPPMASQDRIHLTARGYVRWGMVLGDALMLPFDTSPALLASTASLE